MTSLMSFGNSNVTSTTFTVSTFPLLLKVVQQLKPCHALAELLVDRLSIGTPQLLSVGNCQSCSACKNSKMSAYHSVKHTTPSCRFNSPVGKYSGKKYTANSKINVTNQWRRFSEACATEVTQAPITVNVSMCYQKREMDQTHCDERGKAKAYSMIFMTFHDSVFRHRDGHRNHLPQDISDKKLFNISSVDADSACTPQCPVWGGNLSIFSSWLTNLFPEKSKFDIGKVGTW